MSDNRTDSLKASAWESVVVAQMRPKVVRMALGIRGLAHLKWDAWDAENELLLSAVMACRTWAVQHATEPPAGYVMQAIVRKRYRIWEKVRKAYEQVKLEAGPYESKDVYSDYYASGGVKLQTHATRTDTDTTPLSNLEVKSDEGSHARAVYRLRQKLPPSDFAMLQLRTMDYSTREIAEIMDLHKEGKPDHQEVSRKLYRIRKKAAEFLKQVGIYTIKDVEEADHRSVFHDRQPKTARQ